jgi:hypothetical protein
MIGCNDSGKSDEIGGDTAPKFQKSDLEFLGCSVPASIEELDAENEVYRLGLSPHSRWFYFNKNELNVSLVYESNKHFFDQSSLHGNVFLKLLEQAEQENKPVRIYVYPKTNEIWWVEEATEEDLKRFEESKKP